VLKQKNIVEDIGSVRNEEHNHSGQSGSHYVETHVHDIIGVDFKS